MGGSGFVWRFVFKKGAKVKLRVALTCAGILAAGVFCTLSHESAIATESGSHGCIDTKSAERSPVEPSSKTPDNDSGAGRRPEERSEVEVDSKVQKEGGDREEMERRKRMFF